MRKKKAITNIIVSVLYQVITIIYGFVISKLIIENYGSNVNGLLNSITRFLSYIVLLELGFGPVVRSVLYKPIANKDKNELQEILKTSERFFKKVACIFLIYIIIIAIVLPFIISNEFDFIFTASLVIISAVSVFAEYYFGMTYKLYLYAEQKNYIVLIFQSVTLLINIIIIALMVKFGYNIQVVKLVSAFIFLLRPIIINFYVKKKYKINLKEIKGNYNLKQKWDGMAQHIAYVININTDVVLLTFFGNLSEISVYSIYYMIINKINNIVQSFIGGVDATFGDMIAKKEKDLLNKSFEIYEVFYNTISTILFSSTLFLIVPFIFVYTKGITDANYIRPEFAYLLVIAKFISSIRLPYNNLIKTAGHFKQTKIGAWIEAILNISISCILVGSLGIVGLVIGTLIAMLVRCIEFMYYASKNILERNIFYTVKHIIIIVIEVLIILGLVNILPKVDINNYSMWILQALKVFGISTLVVLTINSICYKNIVKEAIKKYIKKDKEEKL